MISSPTCCTTARNIAAGEEVKVARITAFVRRRAGHRHRHHPRANGQCGLPRGIGFRGGRGSANLPVIIFSMFWKRFTTAGAVAGLAVGLVSSIIADRALGQRS